MMNRAPDLLTPWMSWTLRRAVLMLLGLAVGSCESMGPTRGQVRLTPTHHSIVYGRVSDRQHRAVPNVPIYPGLGWGGPVPAGTSAPSIVSVQPSSVVTAADGSFRFVLQLNLPHKLPSDFRADIAVATPRHLQLGGALVFIPLGRPITEPIDSTRLDVVLEPPLW